MFILKWLIGPIGRYVVLAFAGLAAYGIWEHKVRRDAVIQIEHKQLIERRNAVQKGTAARDSAIRRFDDGSMSDDGFARD